LAELDGTFEMRREIRWEEALVATAEEELDVGAAVGEGRVTLTPDP
jgi:hypothetical protein